MGMGEVNPVGNEPGIGPCAPWITADDVFACCGGLSQSVDLAGPIAFATNVLFRLSGKQFPGVCSRTVRPCAGDNQGCGYGGATGPFWNVWPVNALWQFPQWPYRDNGQWFNTALGGCADRCYLPEVILPAAVSGVTEVVIDGVVLPQSAYKVVQFEKVARIDGSNWPCSNNLRIDSSSYASQSMENDGSKKGTWQITYNYGRSPGADGKMACAILACQIAKNQCGADDCTLPQRLKQITRENVSMAFMDPMDFLSHGLVGIYEVDLWLGSVNPYGQKRRPSIRRADERKRYQEFT